MPPQMSSYHNQLSPLLLLPSSLRSFLFSISHTASPPTHSPLTKTSIRTIKSTFKPKPDRFAHHPAKPALTGTSTAALARKATSLPLRTGLLANKKGMMAHYNPESGERTPCTVLQLDRNQVVAHKTRQKHGYWAVQVGAGQKESRNVTKPMLGHFAGAGVHPKRWLAEFQVRDEKGLQVGVGEWLSPRWFSQGQWVDVKAVSRGMGFAGGMKKHGFGGQPASHGQSLMHRGMGSAGGSQGSGSRVLPGKRMPGKMGNESVTVKNLKVLLVDEKNGILVVKGCVPGPKNQIIQVSDAKGKPWPKGPMTITELLAADVMASSQDAEALSAEVLSATA